MPTSAADHGSPRLGLPYLQPSQAQKHVTHNEALKRLDALVQLTVLRFGAELPPETAPDPGTVYALGPAPTGIWAPHPERLALWDGQGWDYVAPAPGWRAWARETEELRVWDGTGWRLPAGAAAADRFDHLQGVGVNAAADAANRLSVSSAATLLSHEGGGHRVKINKAAPGQTASLVFQTGFSGRAEIGLAGRDALSVKTSADGAAWTEAICVDAAGAVGIGTPDPAAPLHVAGEAIFGRVSGGALNGNIRMIDVDQYPRIQSFSGTAPGAAQLIFDVAGNALFTDIGEGSGFVQWRRRGPGGTESLMRLDAAGRLGLGTAAPQRRLHVSDALRIEPGPAPATPQAGDFYFDAAAAKLRCHDGTAWRDLF